MEGRGAWGGEGCVGGGGVGIVQRARSVSQEELRTARVCDEESSVVREQDLLDFVFRALIDVCGGTVAREGGGGGGVVVRNDRRADPPPPPPPHPHPLFHLYQRIRDSSL